MHRNLQSRLYKMLIFKKDIIRLVSAQQEKMQQ